MKNLLSILIVLLSFGAVAQSTHVDNNQHQSQFILKLNVEITDQPVILSMGGEYVEVERRFIRGKNIALFIYADEEYTLSLNGGHELTFNLSEWTTTSRYDDFEIVAAVIQ